MRITISTLFFYNPDLCRDFIKAVLPSLVDYSKRTDNKLTFAITDNTPKSQSLLDEILPILHKHENSRLKFVTYQHGHNMGFGGAHNKVFQDVESDIFIVLNNDLFMHSAENGDNWIEKLCVPLINNDRIALVGVKSSPSILSNEGEGAWLKDESQAPDYAEGSILAVRSSVGRDLGLFSPDLKTAYYEDSDLSLRYRQCGHTLAFVDISHEHRRGSSSRLVDPVLLASIRLKNKSRFMTRWREYFTSRSFKNRIFLDFTSGGWGDVVAAIPVVTGLLRDHPTAEIELQTNQIALNTLLSFPRVTIRTSEFKTLEQARQTQEFDRLFSLTEVDYTSALNLGMQLCATAGVDFDIALARRKVGALTLGASSRILEVLKKSSQICVIHTESLRPGWEGRSLNPGILGPALEYLKTQGYFLVLIGAKNDSHLRKVADLDLTDQTTLEETFQLISQSQLFFGMDSGPLHIAQFFNVKSFAVFGATLPTARLLNLDNSYGYVRNDLSCIACYHRHIPSPNNYCIRRDEACVTKIDPNELASALKGFLDGESHSSMAPAWAAEAHALIAKQSIVSKGSVELLYPDLSQARLRELIVALMVKIKAIFVRRVIRR